MIERLGDNEYLGLVDASLKLLSRTRQVKFERVGEVRTYLIGRGRESWRVVLGESAGMRQFHDRRLLLVGWGNRPIAFLNRPDVDVSYLDLRFEIHSAVLDDMANEFKKCLEAQGCTFRELVHQPRLAKAGTGFSLRRLKRVLNRNSVRRS